MWIPYLTSQRFLFLDKISLKTSKNGNFRYFRQLWGRLEEIFRQITAYVTLKNQGYQAVAECLHHSNPRKR